MKDQISNNIKKARLDADRTQLELANHLGKTSASISDIERGKVHISASELFEVAKFLEKPIEFFYGAEIKEPIKGHLEASVQNSDKNELEEIMTMLFYVRNLKKFTKFANKKYKPNEKLDREDMLEFYKIILPYFELLNKKRSEVLEMKQRLERTLEISD
jgi:transcriptional regulator with XRE-family HTH domain